MRVVTIRRMAFQRVPSWGIEFATEPAGTRPAPLTIFSIRNRLKQAAVFDRQVLIDQGGGKPPWCHFHGENTLLAQATNQ